MFFFFVFEFLPIRILIARSSVLKFLAHFLNFFMISLLISVIYNSGDKAYQWVSFRCILHRLITGEVYYGPVLHRKNTVISSTIQYGQCFKVA